MYDEIISELLGSTIFIREISIGARNLYAIILPNFFYEEVRKDKEGLYIQLNRNRVAEKLNVCVATARKYIKELQDEGFIKDVRIGLHKCNKIYLKDRTMLALVEKLRWVFIED